MKTSIHTEVGQLKSVFLGPVRSMWNSQAELDEWWQKLNYLSEPSYSQALSEYHVFRELLIKENIELLEFDPNGQEISPDAIYCRDASVMTNYGAILCNMGKAQRATEPEMHRKSYQNHSIPMIGEIVYPGSLEGGDVAWLNEQTLAVGLGYRTNVEGIAQLKKLLSNYEIDVVQVDLPHYKGPQDVFHLMSIFSPVAKKVAVTYSPLMPVSFRNRLLDMSYTLVEVPDEEFETLGCNVLALNPQKCLMVEGSPRTQKSLEKMGIEVLAYPGKEISIKGGGGPTCLTRPYQREV